MFTDFYQRHITWVYSFVLALLLVGGYTLVFAPPSGFPSGDIVTVASGASSPEVASELGIAQIVRHPRLLQIILRISGESAHIQAGSYLFFSPENVFTVAYRLVAGDYGLPPVRVTFPEGETARDIAERVNEAFPSISASSFLKVAQQYEGYLFPDTYLFTSSVTATSIVKTMRDNFNVKTAAISSDLNASGHSLSDIVIMASLVEKEARTSAVRHIVAGILWNRFRLGMPLQVDAVFGYIKGRDTYSPSFADLQIDSPYNTYTHTGLPPGPIDNPGLDSIGAVLNPTKTDYLYYLTDKNGVMHYATTYAGHQANQRKYLQ